MNFLFGFQNRNETKSKVGPLGVFLRSDLGFFGLRIQRFDLSEFPRSNLKIPFPFYSFLSLFFLLSFLLTPHTAFASGIARTPSNLGLVGYWSFNENSGTIATDYSGSGNNGTLVSVGSPNGFIKGKLGNGLWFDGLDDNVLVANSSTLNMSGATAFTISAWIKVIAFNTISTCHADTIVAKDADPNSGSYYLNISDTNICSSPTGIKVIDFGFRDTGGSQYRVVGSTPLQTNTWYQLTAVYNGATMKVYVNGVEDGSLSVTAGVGSNTATLSIGENSLNPGGFNYNTNSIIDEVRIYNRGLSVSEISNLYRSGVTTRKGASNLNLAGYWPLNEGFGTADNSVIGDVSGNNNFGTTSNFSDPSTLTSGWSKGRNGYVLNFDGADDIINILDSTSLTLASDITFAAWVYPTAYGVAGKQYIAQIFGDESVNCQATVFRLGSQGLSLYQARIGVSYTDVSSGVFDDQSNSDIPLNRWTHIAVTTDGSFARYYINGVLDATNAWAHSPRSQTCPWGIGNNRGVNRPYAGGLSDVRLYSRVLSSDEIAAIANQSFTRVNVTDTTSVANGLLASWSFDGKYMDWSTNKALDSSGNGNDAQMFNTSTSTTPTVGKRGQAIKITAINDNLIAPSISLDNRSFTLAAWIKKTSNGAWHIAIGQGSGSSGSGLHFGLRNNSFPTCAFYGNDLDANTVISDFDWHHVVCSYNLSTGKRTIYVDGVQDGIDVSSVSNYTGTGSVYLGYAPFIGFVSDPMWLDDVRIYNRALSASEALQLYNSGK